MIPLSERLHPTWDFEVADGSEARLRALLVETSGEDALVVRTQVARARPPAALGLLRPVAERYCTDRAPRFTADDVGLKSST